MNDTNNIITDKNKLLVIVVTFNAMKWAERCFSSIRASSCPADVYVIDNGSTDGTQDYIKQNFNNYLFFQCESNIGFGLANNIGLNYALDRHYSYVYLLNQDAWVLPETFSRLMEAFENHPDFGVISPFQLEANMEHLDKNFALAICKEGYVHNVIDGLYFNSSDSVFSVDGVMASHWMISAECLSKVGLFSPTFTLYGEDDNFTDRCKYRGYKVGVDSLSKAVHDREGREMSIQNIMNRTYTRSLRELSNPLGKHAWVTVLFINFRDVLKYKSLVPFLFFAKIILSLNEIKKNKKISISRNCAFRAEKL